MPFAIEPIVKPTLDIPAPIVTVPQAGDRTSGSAPSFQDHLSRAGRSNDGPSVNSNLSSNTSANERADAQARRNDDDGDRAEAEIRDEAAANESRSAESTAPKADDSKAKPANGETKLEEKKKTGEQQEKDEKQQGDDAATVAAVAVAGVQEATAQDEVTLSTDEVGSIAEGKGTEPALPTDEKSGQGIGLPIDPTLAKLTKEQAAAKDGSKGADQDARIAATLAETPVKDDAAEKNGDAAAEELPAVPLMSELHSTKIAGADDKKAKTRAEFVTESSAADPKNAAEAVDAAVDATAVKQSTDGSAALAAQAIDSEKESAKTDGPPDKSADPSFSAQLQGAVEAAAAAPTTVATTDATNATPTTDPTASTTAVATTTTDATKTVTTKTSDATLTAAESLRSNSSKETTTGRVAGEEARQSDGLSTADRARLVQRVARAVRTAHERGGELQIRLSPPELGQLRLQIQMTDGTLSARIEAESPQAKQVITENLGQLRERLAEQNVRVERIDVELMNTGNGGSPNLPDRRQDFSHDGPTPRGFATAVRNGGSGDAAIVEPVSPSTGVAGNGRLNVVI